MLLPYSVVIDRDNGTLDFFIDYEIPANKQGIFWKKHTGTSIIA